MTFGKTSFPQAAASLCLILAGAGATVSCGPGIRFQPARQSDIAATSRIFFSSRTALDTAWDGSASGSENIWSIQTDRTNATAFTQNGSTSLSSFSPALSASGAQIAFHSLSAINGSWNGTSSASSNIWIMNTDGTARLPLTRNTSAGLHSRSPTFSPDCGKLVFSSSTALNTAWDGTPTGSPNIWTIDANGANLTPLTENTAPWLGSFSPVYSPDGTKIAFASATSLDGLWDGTRTPLNIWIMNSDGTGRTALTRNTNAFASLDSQHPVFTPDGTRIVFSSTTALNGDWDGTPAAENIWIMNIDGSARTALTQNTNTVAASSNPDISLDGAWIVFQSKTALSGSWSDTPLNVSNIWLIRTDGTSLTALTTSETASSSLPAFSADSLSVVFWSQGSLDGDWTQPALFTENLWRIERTGANKLPLTLNTNPDFSGTLSAPAPMKTGSCIGGS